MKKIIQLSLIGLCLSACQPTGRQTSQSGTIQPLRYARGFRMEYLEHYTLLTIYHPLDTALVFGQYVCYRGDTIPYFPYTAAIPIQIPVTEIAAVSTTQLGYLDALEAHSNLVGFAGTRWVFNPVFRRLIQQGDIVELGMDGNPNLESLLVLQPDIILSFSTELAGYKTEAVWEQAGLPVLYFNEFLETHPLGMAEWIKVMGLLLDKMDMADSYFDKVESDYQTWKAKAAQAGKAPFVLTGFPFKGEWTVSGGKSFAAQYLQDAGAFYVWRNDQSTGNFPVALEEVLVKAAEADIWINPGGAANLQEMKQGEPRIKGIKALQNKRVYSNTARLIPEGGNDYWESAVVNPHLVLKDLVTICHPALFPADSLYYYLALP